MSARLAWVVLAHSRPHQLGRLLRRLAAPGDAILVHIDGKVPLGPFEAEIAGAGDSVELLPRIPVRWSTFDVAQATLTGMRVALERGADYVNVISGQDYPIKPVEELRAHLAGSGGTAFMLYFPLPQPDWGELDDGLGRVNRRHYYPGPFEVKVPGRLTPFVPKRRMPLGHQPYAGSNWFSLPRDCVAHVLDFLAANRSYERFYRRGGFPAEGMFHTILLNSNLRDRVRFDDLRYIVWLGESHPRTLVMSDLETMAVSPSFLARKFDCERDPALLDAVDERLLGSEPPVVRR